ncbi:MAG: lysine--tRNA ligase, partial [Bdellovibrionota bacterium]
MAQDTPVSTPAATEQDLSEQVRVRFEKLGRIRDRKENPYRNGFEPSALAQDLHSKYGAMSKEELEAAA